MKQEKFERLSFLSVAQCFEGIDFEKCDRKGIKKVFDIYDMCEIYLEDLESVCPENISYHPEFRDESFNNLVLLKKYGFYRYMYDVSLKVLSNENFAETPGRFSQIIKMINRCRYDMWCCTFNLPDKDKQNTIPPFGIDLDVFIRKNLHAITARWTPGIICHDPDKTMEFIRLLKNDRLATEEPICNILWILYQGGYKYFNPQDICEVTRLCRSRAILKARKYRPFLALVALMIEMADQKLAECSKEIITKAKKLACQGVEHDPIDKLIGGSDFAQCFGAKNEKYYPVELFLIQYARF